MSIQSRFSGAGKRRAKFERAVLPHLDALYGSAYRLTRNAGDAEDLVQDSLLRAYRFWDSFEDGSNCKAWLFKIVTNTFINSYQRKKRSKEIIQAAAVEQETTDGVLMHAAAVTQRSPADVMVEQSLSEDVQKALASIPADFRVTVVLCDVEGFSYKEISDIIECPVGTVMSRLYRGRRLLKKELQQFAQSQGILKTQKSPPQNTTVDNPVDLDDYRRQKNKAN